LFRAVSIAALLAASLSSPGAEPDQDAARAFGDSKNALLRLNPVTALSARSFASPPMTDWPWVRLNMPASAQPDQLRATVEDLYRSGIGGLEVGQGAHPDEAQSTALLTAANRRGIKVSLSHGPTKAPVGYSVDDEHTRKALDVGAEVVVAATSVARVLQPPALRPAAFPGARAPLPSPRSALIAVLAYRCTATPCPTTGIVQLDPSSVIDLSSTVSDTNANGYAGGSTSGKLEWRAPAFPEGSQWMLLSFWARGIHAQPDPFSKEGHQQLIQGMEQAWSPDIKRLLKQNAGDLFYDSHSVDRGSPDEMWSNGIGQEFAGRFGYPLTRQLAALFPARFAFSDGSDGRIRADFFELRGEKWLRDHIGPLTIWAHGYNQRLRLQPEGELDPVIGITDQVKAAFALDRPEHESLFVADEVDNYLPIASANHMRGNPWYSTECCAALNRNYAQTFQDLIIRMHRSFAGGIKRLVYHVYPYRDAPQARWPGYHNFPAVGFSNAWGPRNPIWVDARSYNDYLARNHQVLTQGDAKVDVAVYMQNYLYPAPFRAKDGFRIWRDTALQEAGYTRDYLSPALLDLPNATVTNGRLAVNGPGYKALIIDSELNPPTEPIKTAMPVAAAERILRLARNGLAVIIVGQPPATTPGNTPGDDVRLRAVIQQLLAESTVRRVARERDVPGALRAMGIQPAAEPDTPSSLLSLRRRDESLRTDYYFLYNQGVVSPAGEPENLFEPATGTTLERTVLLEGRGEPYVLDAWTGKVTAVQDYVVAGGRIGVKVRLAPDDATIIAVTESAARLGFRQRARPPSASQRAPGAGTAEALPTAIDLGNRRWSLELEDWQPANDYHNTTGTTATETRKTVSKRDLQRVAAWTTVAGLDSVSGIGTYSTEFELPAQWSRRHGATLRLGEVLDSFVVTVNGRTAGVNQISGECDVSELLRPGRNTLVVRVASTINNRLNALDSQAAKRGLVQKYGLTGPVTLVPYRKIL
jgi:hypothetical protein